jgi:tetratricopeptide (TPR) repeat protein
MISFMQKKIYLLNLIFFISLAAHAQSADSVYNKYLDFNLARLQGEKDKVLELGEKIIPDADKLPEKARISFYFSVGKMYEDNNEPARALPYYEKVFAAVPDYYVVNRALGYLYLDDVKAIEKKLSAASNVNTTNEELTKSYENAIRKALPRLEKAQACDPSDETFAIIKTLYQDINDKTGLKKLNDRLKLLSLNCVDILEDH